MGITVHNKAEMDAFLKEHGIDDVQALFNSAKKNALSDVPSL